MPKEDKRRVFAVAPDVWDLVRETQREIAQETGYKVSLTQVVSQLITIGFAHRTQNTVF